MEIIVTKIKIINEKTSFYIHLFYEKYKIILIHVYTLMKEKIIAPGSYFIKWEMYNFPEGRYWCEFNTPDFIYKKDFYIY